MQIAYRRNTRCAGVWAATLGPLTEIVGNLPKNRLAISDLETNIGHETNHFGDSHLCLLVAPNKKQHTVAVCPLLA